MQNTNQRKHALLLVVFGFGLLFYITDTLNVFGQATSKPTTPDTPAVITATVTVKTKAPGGELIIQIFEAGALFSVGNAVIHVEAPTIGKTTITAGASGEVSVTQGEFTMETVGSFKLRKGGTLVMSVTHTGTIPTVRTSPENKEGLVAKKDPTSSRREPNLGEQRKIN